jgi:hypothetical protein
MLNCIIKKIKSQLNFTVFSIYLSIYLEKEKPLEISKGFIL